MAAAESVRACAWPKRPPVSAPQGVRPTPGLRPMPGVVSVPSRSAPHRGGGPSPPFGMSVGTPVPRPGPAGPMRRTTECATAERGAGTVMRAEDNRPGRGVPAGRLQAAAPDGSTGACYRRLYARRPADWPATGPSSGRDHHNRRPRRVGAPVTGRCRQRRHPRRCSPGSPEFRSRPGPSRCAATPPLGDHDHARLARGGAPRSCAVEHERRTPAKRPDRGSYRLSRRSCA